MRRKHIIATCILILLTYASFAQTQVKLTKPFLELEANNINIFYDILNSSQTDKFKIWIEITDSTGNIINAKSLVGDLGENVSGGNNKKITWDLTADSIYLDAGIYVQINAEALVIAERIEIDEPANRITRGGAIFQSVLFPGLGLSRINRGKPHWLKGVAGYGCIAGSVVYNKKAVASYDSYLNADNSTDIDNFFNTSVKEDNISEYLAYAAIGIWVIDFIWTIGGSSKLNNNQSKGFSVNPEYDPMVNAPMITIAYKF